MQRKHIDDASSSTTNSDSNQAHSKRPMSHSASSAANLKGYAYEVFLSFRGSDTRKGFTDYLYTSLTDAGIRAFRDNEELRVGEEIGGNLLEAITQSKIFIPIFSKDYASSKWCLKEAAHMMKSRNSKNHSVLPIFYNVMPHQVKHQSGTYEEAFKQHSERYDEKTIQEWRNALAEIGAMKGWELQNEADGHEGELVRIVVSEVRRTLKKAHLIIEDSIIKLEDSIEAVMGMLRTGSSDVRAVGIYGIGGIGKTTLAKIIYNQLLQQFESSSYLEGIRARGLEKLQTQLVNDILRYKDEFANVDEGIKVLSENCRSKKVLILLDDVDNKKQIKALAGDLNWFAEGSRIIITTRDRDVLDASEVKETYEVRSMQSEEALLLFSMHAFKGDFQATDYADLSGKIVATTGGLPLALEIIGSFLSTMKSRESWEDTLKKLQNCPDKNVQEKLKISYDALEFEQQQIFLDIACFFIGMDKTIAAYMWKHSGFYPEVDVKVLIQKCLIKIGDHNKLWMHDQLRDLGREIVRNENIYELGKRSRLWSGEDVRQVLLEIQEEEQETKNIRAIQFDYGIKSKDYLFTRQRPINLPNIRFLHLVGDEFASRIRCRSKLTWLQWYHGVDMDCCLSMTNLVILDLSYSNVTNDWSGWSSAQLGIKLKVLTLESCENLLKTPDLSKFHKLERLSLKGCRRLYEVDPSIGKLKNLIFLDLRECYDLKELPKELNDLQSLIELYVDDYGGALPNLRGLKKLELLSAKGCRKLNHIPPYIGHLTSLLEISLDESGVRTLPNSIEYLVKLECLSLRSCRLKKLPDSIGQLISLEKLFLSWSTIQALPDSIGNLTNLQVLLVDNTKVSSLPSALGMLEKLEVIDASGCINLQGEILIDLQQLCSLKTLKLVYCTKLQTLPQLPTSLQFLSVTCEPIETFPNLSFHMNLVELRLVRCIGLKRIPGLGNLVSLKILRISYCNNLTELDELEKLECLRELSISWCQSLEKFVLPKSKQLKTLEVCDCESLQSILYPSTFSTLRSLMFCDKLHMVEGLRDLESLEHLNLASCTAIENLPNLSKLVKLKELSLAHCEKLKELQGLEELKSLEKVDINGSPSLHYYTKKWPHIPWVYFPRLMNRWMEGLKINLIAYLTHVRCENPIHMSDYKVFLSFRHQDLSGHWFKNIHVRVFENDIELIEAMNESKIYIPIFSKGYAFSTQCLKELAHIVECKKNKNGLILPIFYDVSSDQVQEQSGRYEEAFMKHMKCNDAKMVEVWRAALREVGALNGWELQHVRCKKELLPKVVRSILEDIREACIVGIEVHVEEVMKLLEINASDVRMVGIHGMAGTGKTALAKVIYDQLKEHFPYHIFLTNTREASLQSWGLEELQSPPLSEGINLFKYVDKKVLVIVDDVDEREQLDALVPYIGLFDPGSRIIITSRKKEVLDICQVRGTYELNELHSSDALTLFYEQAFLWKGHPSPDLMPLSHEIVSQIKRFPFALKVIGKFLHEESLDEWKGMLKELKEEHDKDVRSMLRIIYERLNDEAQELFLDIACFFIGTHEWITYYTPRIYTGNSLRSVSFLKVLDNNELWMHDQLRDLGREIARGKWNETIRLWQSEEAIKVLNEKQNTEKIKAICLDEGAGSKGGHFGSNQFTLLPNLEFLRLSKANIVGDFNSLLSNLKYLRWHHCPNKLLATNLCLKKLVALEILESDITDDWNGWSFIRMSIKLKVLILKSCRRITKTPDFSTFPELRALIFDDCTKLSYVDPSIGRIERLDILSVKGCSRLKVLPLRLNQSLHKLCIDGTCVKDLNVFQNQERLSYFSLKNCKSLRELPSFIGRLEYLHKIDLSHTSIHALPDSIGELELLQELNMSASDIEYLPRTLGKLKRLKVIDVSKCRKLEGEVILEPMRLFSLTDFIMDGTNITLPPSISGLLRLRRLNWAGCYMPWPVDESNGDIS